MYTEYDNSNVIPDLDRDQITLEDFVKVNNPQIKDYTANTIPIFLPKRSSIVIK